MRRGIAISSALFAVALALGPAASAEFTTYFDAKQSWSQAAGNPVTLDFVGVENGQILPFDWYTSDYGITLSTKLHPEGWSWSLLMDPFTLDGWSAASGGPGDALALSFSTPQFAFAYEEAVASRGELISASFYLQGVLVGTSTESHPFFPGGGVHFCGWTSSLPFDRVAVNNGGPVDNMYIVPAPGAGWALLLLAPRRTRRSRA